ncbi:hypothetical protein ACWD1W_07625 [Streptomyces olivaceoviridis]
MPREWAEGRYPPVRFMVLWGPTGVGGRAQTRRAPGGDVAMLRQDQMFLAEDGTPWVCTDPAPDALDDDIRWHRPPWREYDRSAGGGFLWLGGVPAAAREAVWSRVRGGRPTGSPSEYSGRCWSATRRPGVVPGRRGTRLVGS